MQQRELSLDRLPVGRPARVVSLTAQGPVRRRMLDLGLISGTRVEPLYTSPAGNPVAYLIRGAVIALRRDASVGIIVTEC